MNTSTSTSQSTDRRISEERSTPVRPRRLWLWFVVGFLAVFVTMSLLITQYSMHPSGEFVVSHKLWQYYLIEVQRAIGSSGNLGPASGSSSGAISTAVQHILLSVVGGMAMVGIGWGVGKINRSRRKQ